MQVPISQMAPTVLVKPSVLSTGGDYLFTLLGEKNHQGHVCVNLSQISTLMALHAQPLRPFILVRSERFHTIV